MVTSRSIRKGQRARVVGTADPRPRGAARAGATRVAAAVEQGNVLRERGCLAEAAASYERAVRIDPGCADAYYRLGDTLVRLGQVSRAIAAYRAAVLAAPGLADAYRDLAAALVGAGRADEAVVTCRRGLALAGDDPAIHVRLAEALMAMGELEAGLAEYEWRLRCPEYGVPATEAPRWDGWSLDGRTILLHAEGGHDDTLRLVRYAALVEESGGRVVLACAPELVSLLGRVDGVSEAVPLGGRLPPHSTWAPLPSLPRLLDTTPETVPAGVPYLRPREDLVTEWADRLASGARGCTPMRRPNAPNAWSLHEQPLKVGLVWAGDPSRADADLHTLAPAGPGPLAGVPGVQFIGLHATKAGPSTLAAPSSLPLIELGPELEDFEDLAAVISQLDLVITVDSAVAHLAGGLGRPVWVLLPAAHDWRWERDREETPWYPTMRLFRPGKTEAWDGLVARVAAELALFADDA